MSLKPLVRLFRDGRLGALASANAGLKPFYKLTYLAAAGESGLLGRLAAAPATFDELTVFFGANGQGIEALKAWLQMGIRLRLLTLGPGGYALRGQARALARPENDATLAVIQEVAGLHHKLIAGTLPRLRSNQLWTLDDQDGELIARSSRILEAFQAEAIQEAFPSSGAVRLLDIGCGSGVYLKYAADHNPALTAVGIELQPAVAAMAQANLRDWGLGDRVQVEVGDIRSMVQGQAFDIATLYNNIYYFPVEERVAVLTRTAGFLKPGGFLFLITCCQGGSLGAEALNLWAAATDGAGRLPVEEELVDQLQQAGYRDVRTKSLIPGDRFLSFQAFRT